MAVIAIIMILIVITIIVFLQLIINIHAIYCESYNAL